MTRENVAGALVLAFIGGGLGLALWALDRPEPSLPLGPLLFPSLRPGDVVELPGTAFDPPLEDVSLAAEIVESDDPSLPDDLIVVQPRGYERTDVVRRADVLRVLVGPELSP
jgi:hypothetical protein